MEIQFGEKYRFHIITISFVFFTLWLFLIFSLLYSYFLYEKISNIRYEDLIKYKFLDKKANKTSFISYNDWKLNLLLADSYAERGNFNKEEDNGVMQDKIKKDFEKAINYYEKAIVSNPLSGESHLKLGILYADLKMNNKSSSELKKAAFLDPKNAYHQFDVGRYFFYIKNYENGVEALKKANTLVSQFLPESLKLVWSARGSYQDLIDVTPEDSSAFLTLGKFLLGKEMWEEAIAIYKKAISLDPDNPFLYKSLSSAYEMRGMFDEALKVIEGGIKKLPKSADMYFSLAIVYLKRNEFNEAVFNIKKAIKLCNDKFDNKPLIEYHQTLSEIYYNKIKDYEKALEEAEFVLKLNPSESRAYFLKGLCYKSMDSDLSEMIDSFKKAVLYSPQDLKYRMTLAENYFLYGLYRESLAEWEDIRKLFPKEKLVEQKIKEVNEAIKNDQSKMVRINNYR